MNCAPTSLWLRLSRDGAGCDSAVEIVNGADSSNETGLAREAEKFAEAVDAFDSGAVRAENARGLILLQLGGGPGKLLVGGGEKMETADSGVDRSGTEKTAGVLQRVDDPGMAAAGEQDKAMRSVEDERLIIGHGVFHPCGSGVDLGARRIILFGVDAWNGAAEPDAGKNLFGFVVYDEDAAGGFVVFFHLDHGVGIVAATLEENALCNVNAGERFRIRFGKFAAQRHEAGRMVVMKVAKDYVLNIAEIDFQFAGILENCVGAGARVEKDFVAVGFDEGGETPFADTVVGEHSRENS